MFKSIVVAILEFQTRRFLAKHKPKIVAVTGSVGKTSTKLFTATVLAERYRVLVHEGNRNTELSVPLTIMDIEPPNNIKDIVGWVKALIQTHTRVAGKFEYDIIVVELGADHAGDIEQFRRYLRPNIGVVTAVAPEHMESFKTLEAVAQEELAITSFSDLAVINRDDIDESFDRYIMNSKTCSYGLSEKMEYRFEIESFSPSDGFRGRYVSPEYGPLSVELHLPGEHNIKSAVAAATVATNLGLSPKEIVNGMAKIRPVAGRMQVLRGVNGSTIIDDSYNSSPKAVVSALQALYKFPAEQRIAILGSMNELGDFSKEAHEMAARACDPSKLEWVITIGDEAKRYLAPVAAALGCQVRSFLSPYDAGAFAHKVLRPHAVVLIKGSQNRVFAEEAVKVLLHDAQDEQRLVRQSPYWLSVKQAQFDLAETVNK